MPQPSHSSAPPVDFGIISTVLGSIGLALFFLPILAIPIAACGAASSLLGIVHALRGGQSNPRWAIVGIGVSLTAIAIGLWLAYAPIGLSPSRAAPESVWAPQGHLYVAPPAKPSG